MHQGIRSHGANTKQERVPMELFIQNLSKRYGYKLALDGFS